MLLISTFRRQRQLGLRMFEASLTHMSFSQGKLFGEMSCLNNSSSSSNNNNNDNYNSSHHNWCFLHD